MDEIKKANELLKGIMSQSNRLEYCIDTIGLPYVHFRDRFVWPSVHSMNPLVEEKFQITGILIERLPDFVTGCSLMPETRPHREISKIQYAREYEQEGQKFLYLFNVSADYLGGARKEEIVVSGSQGISPSILTDRIYYTARIVPVKEVYYRDGGVADFDPLKIREARFKVEFSETIRDVWSTILFDEIDYTTINKKITDRYAFETEWKLGRLAFPFVIDHMTICLNLIDPSAKMIDQLLPLFFHVFQSVIHDGDLSYLDDDSRARLKRFYSEWDYSRFLSNSENTHWSITRMPFQEEGR